MEVEVEVSVVLLERARGGLGRFDECRGCLERESVS